jgi:hypothetical protein
MLTHRKILVLSKVRDIISERNVMGVRKELVDDQCFIDRTGKQIAAHIIRSKEVSTRSHRALYHS